MVYFSAGIIIRKKSQTKFSSDNVWEKLFTSENWNWIKYQILNIISKTSGNDYFKKLLFNENLYVILNANSKAILKC